MSRLPVPRHGLLLYGEKRCIMLVLLPSVCLAEQPGSYLASFSNPILQAVVTGMAKTQPERIRLCATRALFNALEFARKNLESERERNYVMTIICEVAQSPDAKTRTAAFECLVKIASLYYRHLGEYMEAIFSVRAIITSAPLCAPTAPGSATCLVVC